MFVISRCQERLRATNLWTFCDNYLNAAYPQDCGTENIHFYDVVNRLLFLSLFQLGHVPLIQSRKSLSGM